MIQLTPATRGETVSAAALEAPSEIKSSAVELFTAQKALEVFHGGRRSLLNLFTRPTMDILCISSLNRAALFFFFFSLSAAFRVPHTRVHRVGPEGSYRGPGVVGSWKTWKSPGILKWLSPGPYNYIFFQKGFGKVLEKCVLFIYSFTLID